MQVFLLFAKIFAKIWREVLLILLPNFWCKVLLILSLKSVSNVSVVLIGPGGVFPLNSIFLDLLRVTTPTISPVLPGPISYSESESLSLLS